MAASPSERAFKTPASLTTPQQPLLRRYTAKPLAIDTAAMHTFPHMEGRQDVPRAGADVTARRTRNRRFSCHLYRRVTFAINWRHSAAETLQRVAASRCGHGARGRWFTYRSRGSYHLGSCAVTRCNAFRR